MPGADILKIYDVGAWLAGPVVRDKLWFSGSWHQQALDQYLLGNYDANGSPGARRQPDVDDVGQGRRGR